MTTPTPPRAFRLVAHRGAPAVAPEHTIPAYEAAVRAGATALELDVRQTADEQLVVIHDERLERTTDGTGVVSDLTVRELKRLDAGRWFGRAFRGQRIQTLAEILERFRDRVGFSVDLQGGSDFHPGIEERVVTLLQLYGVVASAMVTSLDHHALVKCRDLDPELATGAIVNGRLLAPGDLAPRGVLDALFLPARLTRERDVLACREAGLDCYLWLVDDPAAVPTLRTWGVAGLVTDRIELMGPAVTPAGRPPRPPAEWPGARRRSPG